MATLIEPHENDGTWARHHRHAVARISDFSSSFNSSIYVSIYIDSFVCVLYPLPLKQCWWDVGVRITNILEMKNFVRWRRKFVINTRFQPRKENQSSVATWSVKFVRWLHRDGAYKIFVSYVVSCWIFEQTLYRKYGNPKFLPRTKQNISFLRWNILRRFLKRDQETGKWEDVGDDVGKFLLEWRVRHCTLNPFRCANFLTSVLGSQKYQSWTQLGKKQVKSWEMQLGFNLGSQHPLFQIVEVETLGNEKLQKNRRWILE